MPFTPDLQRSISCLPLELSVLIMKREKVWQPDDNQASDLRVARTRTSSDFNS